MTSNGPGGDFHRREHAIGEGDRLRIERERLFRPGPAVDFGARQPFRQQSKQRGRFVAALDALQGEDREHAAHGWRSRGWPRPPPAQLAHELAAGRRLVETALLARRVARDPLIRMQRGVGRTRVAGAQLRKFEAPTDERRRAAGMDRLLGHQLFEIEGPGEAGVAGPQKA